MNLRAVIAVGKTFTRGLHTGKHRLLSAMFVTSIVSTAIPPREIRTEEAMAERWQVKGSDPLDVRDNARSEEGPSAASSLWAVSRVAILPHQADRDTHYVHPAVFRPTRSHPNARLSFTRTRCLARAYDFCMRSDTRHDRISSTPSRPL